MDWRAEEAVECAGGGGESNRHREQEPQQETPVPGIERAMEQDALCHAFHHLLYCR